MLKIRHFEPSDNEYAEICRVHNLEWPKHPSTVRSYTWGDENWNNNYLFQRFVAELDGKMIVEGAYYVPFWSFTHGKFQMGWSLDPAYIDYKEDGKGIHQQMYDYVLSELADRNPTLLSTSTREDKQDRLDFLAANGFEFQMRYPESELAVDEFDFTPYDGLSAKLAEKGIEISTLDKLMESDPNWLNKIYELCWDIYQDVPSPDPPAKESLEEWQKGLKSPNFLNKGCFVAVDTNIDARNYQETDGRGDYVGVSMLEKDEVLPEKMHTSLTGVGRSHRRQGVATAMKLKSIELAKGRGAKTISTGNEENNPMYQLNVRLGFKPKPAWADYHKIL
ncbi:MAG: GNAT family N-acetyltransferase [Chloroflexota bacterium]